MARRSRKQKEEDAQALAPCKPYHPYRRRIPKVSADHVVKVRQQQVLSMFADGNPADVIAAAMGMQRNHVKRDLKIALNDMLAYWADPSPQHTFVRYAAFQLGIVHKLQETYGLFMESPDPAKYGALVNSLRAQSDIFDKVLKQGVSMGVIRPRKRSKQVDSQPRNIRVELRREIQTLERLLTEIDDPTALRLRRKPAQPARQTSITLLTRVRKLKRNALGFITLIPDWKYRKAIWRPDGKELPRSQQTPDQQATLALVTPDHHRDYLQAQLDQAHGQLPTTYDPQTGKLKILERHQRTTEQVTLTRPAEDPLDPSDP